MESFGQKYLKWKKESGRSAAWIAHSLGVREVGRSNRLAPTIFPLPAVNT